MALQTQSNSIIPVMPYYYKQGLLAVWINSSHLHILSGQCRDVNNLIDMGVGSLNPPPNGGLPIPSSLALLTTVTGPGGLDVGPVASNRMYGIYLIGDSTYKNPVSSLLSLNILNNPLLPSGYDSFRQIGYWPTDSSGNLIQGSYFSNDSTLTFIYQVPQITAVSAGNATSYTEIDIGFWVPSNSSSLANVYFSFSAASAGDILFFQNINTTGDTVKIVSPVGSPTPYTGYVNVPANLIISTTVMNYKVSSASDAVAVYIAGFSTCI